MYLVPMELCQPSDNTCKGIDCRCHTTINFSSHLHVKLPHFLAFVTPFVSRLAIANLVSTESPACYLSFSGKKMGG